MKTVNITLVGAEIEVVLQALREASRRDPEAQAVVERIELALKSG